MGLLGDFFPSHSTHLGMEPYFRSGNSCYAGLNPDMAIHEPGLRQLMQAALQQQTGMAYSSLTAALNGPSGYGQTTIVKEPVSKTPNYDWLKGRVDAFCRTGKEAMCP